MAISERQSVARLADPSVKPTGGQSPVLLPAEESNKAGRQL